MPLPAQRLMDQSLADRGFPSWVIPGGSIPRRPLQGPVLFSEAGMRADPSLALYGGDEGERVANESNGPAGSLLPALQAQ